MHTPGEHVIVVGTEADALQVRAQGLVLRDAITILLPGPRTLTAYLFRVPLEGTVAENVLKHGAGGLGIDGCRIETTESLNGGAYANKGQDRSDGYEVWRYKRLGGAGEFQQPTGRWPSNLLLVHGEGCKRVGERRVPGINTPGSVGGKRHNALYAQDAYSKTYERTVRQCHADPDGLETIAAWECEPGCPVKALDRQSGLLHARGNLGVSKGGAGLE